YRLIYPFDCPAKISGAIAQEVTFRKIPSHRNSLACEGEANEPAMRPSCYRTTCIGHSVYGEGQVYAHSLRISLCTKTAVPQRQVVRLQSRSNCICFDLIACFMNQITE